MNLRSIRWREVIPWTVLGVVLSCGGAQIAPATAPPPAAGGNGTFKSIEVEEIVLRGKDGKVRGKLTGQSLELSNADGGFKIVLSAEAETAIVAVVRDDKVAMLSIDKDSSDMSVAAGGRKIVAGVETERPLADLEVFDASDKRRASFGLNSNGEPRLSLYDANETRRLYGIVTDDVPLLDFNDKSGVSALQLFGADGTRGSGMSATHNAKTTNVGVGLDGKPLR